MIKTHIGGNGKAKKVDKSAKLDEEPRGRLPRLDNGNVILGLRISESIYKRLIIYSKDKGHLSEQETIRLALSLFLDKQGY